MKHPYSFARSTLIILAVAVRFVWAAASPESLTAQPLPRTPVTFEPARIETRFLAGVSMSGTLSTYSAGIPMVYAPICNNLEAGEGLGFSGGLALDYLFNRSLSLSLHTRYGSYPGDFERIQPIGGVETGLDNQPGFLVVRINSAIDYQVLGADLMLKWTSESLRSTRYQVGFAVGPSVSFPITGTMTQTHRLEVYDINGDEITRRDLVENQGKALRERELAGDVEMESMRWQRYAVRAGMFMNLDIGSGVYVTPGFYADLPLVNFADSRWGALNLYEFQVDLMFGI